MKILVTGGAGFTPHQPKFFIEIFKEYHLKFNLL